MEQITVPSVATALSTDGHAPLPKRIGPRTMIFLARLGRDALAEYTTPDGKGASTSATILDWCRFGVVCAIEREPRIDRRGVR
jgi:hypothetical protein